MGAAFRSVAMSPLRCFESAPAWAQEPLSRGDTCEGTSPAHAPPDSVNEEPVRSRKDLWTLPTQKSFAFSCLSWSVLKVPLCFPQTCISLNLNDLPRYVIFWCSVFRGYFPVVGHAPWRVRKGVSAPAFPIDLGAKGGRV